MARWTVLACMVALVPCVVATVALSTLPESFASISAADSAFYLLLHRGRPSTKVCAFP